MRIGGVVCVCVWRGGGTVINLAALLLNACSHLSDSTFFLLLKSFLVFHASLEFSLYLCRHGELLIV